MVIFRILYIHRTVPQSEMSRDIGHFGHGGVF